MYLSEAGHSPRQYRVDSLQSRLDAAEAERQTDRELSERVLNTSCETWEKLNGSLREALAANEAARERGFSWAGSDRTSCAFHEKSRRSGGLKHQRLDTD